MRKINNAKSLSIVTFVMLIFTIGAASAVPSISVKPSTNIVNPGENFTVNITVNPDGSSLHAGAFTLLFNASILQINEIKSQDNVWGFTPGTFLNQDGAETAVFINTSNNTKGTAQYAELRNASTGVSNPGTMASISFHVKESATAGISSILNLSDVQFADPSPSIIDVIVNNESVNIKSTLSKIVISGSPTSTLTVGGTHIFTVTALDQNENPLEGIDISWTVSNSSVGNVDSPKVITNVTGGATSTFTALGEGTTMVNATNGSVKGTAIVTVITTPSITVVSPNGGENWKKSTIQIIRWNYNVPPGPNVKIELLKGGILNRTINSSTSIGSSSSGSYAWLINSTYAQGTDYKIRVTSTTDLSYNGTSNNNFTIGPMTGDINSDCIVNFKDLGILGAAYGKARGVLGYREDADLNGDGIINFKDLGMLGSNYGKTC